VVLNIIYIMCVCVCVCVCVYIHTYDLHSCNMCGFEYYLHK